MELRVETSEGYSMPNGCYVGVRVGDVLKQGRYEPQRCYHFPQVDRRRNAKIDIYQHVGYCVVAVDPDTKSSHELSVTGTNPSLPSTKIKVSVSSKSDESKQHREERTKALKNQAKDYLSKHSIEERLSDAVKALLKEQPTDPTEFLCRFLRGGKTDVAPVKQEASKAEPPAQVEPTKPEPSQAATAPTQVQAATAPTKEVKKEELNVAREKAKAVLSQAANDGTLEKAMQEAKGERTGEDYASEGPAIVLDLEYESPPAFVVPYSSMADPSLMNFGMQPGLMFI
eukprot:TRINITY_DN35685_c0_g1_i1.p1 TRINITY_DN35685_c0_g1~~TRINITY_DN35685_c0_g1_i1.p1  ORF type:complete len:285 (+),score=61.10 TRINITY_DN35685_c0_g1_i1:175-1029(+)